MSWILHMSDPHLGDVSPGQELDDAKITTPQEDLATTQRIFTRTLASLDAYVEANGPPTIAVISGDLTYRARKSGFDAFAQLLVEYASVLPARDRIVVVPGNHDVSWEYGPGDPDRYQGFVAATRAHGCVTPLLDGVDFNTVEPISLRDEALRDPHLIVDDDVIVVPLNSSNWCGTPSTLRGAWDEDRWKERLGSLGDGRDEALQQVKLLQQQDMARISLAQIDALRHLFHARGLEIERGSDPRPRVAVLHHQLLPVSTIVELKAFESLVNLGFVRETLRDFGIDVVLHGHKHQGAIYWDLARRGTEKLMLERRTLVIASPGQFQPHEPVMRALMLTGNPRARNVRVVNFNGVDGSTTQPELGAKTTLPLWLGQMESEADQRVVIHGRSTHETYGRLMAQFELAEHHTLHNLVCEIDDAGDAETLPLDYPDAEAPGKQQWFTELIDWWQLRQSRLVREKKLPFNHGERLHEHWGDQIARAANLLNHRDGSSRGLALLITPEETGLEAGHEPPEEGTYPAFALVEFSVTERHARRQLDCFAYFRKQEMRFWWPVNVGELRRMQAEVCRQLDADHQADSGRIVTVSAIALYGVDLPRVAVTELDRAVDKEGAIFRMAAAAAFPNGADASDGFADWARALDELKAAGRGTMPKPALGHTVLLAELERVAALVAAHAPVHDVIASLRQLCEVYAGVEAPLGPDQRPLVEPALASLREALDRTAQGGTA